MSSSACLDLSGFSFTALLILKPGMGLHFSYYNCRWTEARSFLASNAVNILWRVLGIPQAFWGIQRGLSIWTVLIQIMILGTDLLRFVVLSFFKFLRHLLHFTSFIKYPFCPYKEKPACRWVVWCRASECGKRNAGLCILVPSYSFQDLCVDYRWRKSNLLSVLRYIKKIFNGK